METSHESYHGHSNHWDDLEMSRDESLDSSNIVLNGGGDVSPDRTEPASGDDIADRASSWLEECSNGDNVACALE